LITVEPIHLQDLEELAVLYQDLNAVQTNREEMRKAFHSMENRPEYLLFGAWTEAKELVGSLMGILCTDLIGECRPFVVLENLIVSPGSRRQGVGAKLIQHMEDYARERNCYYTMLVSRMHRTGAHAFYEAVGYLPGVVQGFKKYL
jgi:GNAT superfamily N-acetyltransferase